MAMGWRWWKPGVGGGLDHSSDQQKRAPAGQVLRYLRRADDLTHGALRWGILSNGQCWHLYYAGARSLAAEFFEINLPEVLRDHDHYGLKLFVLLLRPQAFVPGAGGQGLHGWILNEGRRYEERVAANLSDMVFPRGVCQACQGPGCRCRGDWPAPG